MNNSYGWPTSEDRGTTWVYRGGQKERGNLDHFLSSFSTDNGANNDRQQNNNDSEIYPFLDDEQGEGNQGFLYTLLNNQLVKSNRMNATVLFAALIIGYFMFVEEGTIGRMFPKDDDMPRPPFVYQHPYVSSSYYTSTRSAKTLKDTERLQVKKLGSKSILANREFKTRLAVVRPFCEFDAEALPTTFAVWNQLAPCRAAATDLDFNNDEEYATREKEFFDDVGPEVMKDMVADVFLFYSQTYSDNEVAIKAVDTIIDQFNEPGGWSQCFANIYAIEANIPQELDLYIPSAQEELYNWVNGPNRQFEAAFRIIQSGEWGDYDGFYLMEGDSIPIKNHWLDVILSEIEANRPFATMGA
jgi:hypothetical protein